MYPYYYSECALDLDLLESCISADKKGQVNCVEVNMEKLGSGWCTWDSFEYENLNKTNMADFVRELVGEWKYNW